jgi:hypothetical protein
MILEQTPTKWLNAEERLLGICFKKLDHALNPYSWPIGRIFDSEKELSWQLLDSGKFSVIYSGAPRDLSAYSLQKIADDWEISEHDHLLWGTSPKSDRLKQKGTVFFEVQIPRLFEYPISTAREGARPKLKVVVYRDQKLGHIQHYRFARLEVMS